MLNILSFFVLNILSFLHPNFFYKVYSYNFLPLLFIKLNIPIFLGLMKQRERSQKYFGLLALN